MMMMNDVVILIGDKLIGLDSIVPVAMQLKQERPDLRISYVLLNGETSAVINQNYVLASGAAASGTIRILSDRRRRIGRRFVAGLVLTDLMLQLRRRPSLLLSPGDYAPFPFSLLARAARAGGGRAVIFCKPSFPGSKAFNYVNDNQLEGRAPKFEDEGDGFLIYHPTQAQDYRAHTSARPIVVGTPRDMPAWRAHIDKMAGLGILDEHGNQLRKLTRPVFIVFYHGPLHLPQQSNDVRQSFLEFIDIVADVAPKASIVVKPHPLCNVDQMANDIQCSPRPDISISYAHPQLLARMATAAVTFAGSNVMNDMYLEGIPVIETTLYRPDVLRHGESLFPNRGRISAPDPTALREIVASIAAGSTSLPVPDASEISWPRPDDLTGLLLERRQ
jgi:hypothetical protein